MSKKWTNPGDVSFIISSTAETAFQRAIYLLGGCEIEGLGHVQWLDLELPVDSHRKGRGHCLDLVGRLDDMSMVICELKFGKPGNGNPMKAEDQILYYYSEIQNNHQRLDEGELHHKNALKAGYFEWNEVSKPSTKLIIAANADYWNYWDKRGVFTSNKVICSKIDVQTNCFKKQKELLGTKRYKPIISTQSWSIINK